MGSSQSNLCQTVCGRAQDEAQLQAVQCVHDSDTLDEAVKQSVDAENLHLAKRPGTALVVNGSTTAEEPYQDTASEEVAESEQGSAAPDPNYYITIDKSSGETLGVSVNVSASSPGLPVLAIQAGLFQKWNQDNPDRAVTVGDLIIGVNGKEGEAHELAQACATDTVLQLTLQRGGADVPVPDDIVKKGNSENGIAQNGTAEQGAEDAADKSFFQYLIVGGGVCAGYACREFVDNGVRPGSIGIICVDPWPPYERPALTKAYLHPPSAKTRARLPGFHTCVGTGGKCQGLEWYAEHGIRLLTGPATRLDVEKKQLETADGACYSYEKLLLATGCSPTVPDMPGAKLEGVHYLREEGHAAALVKHLESIGEGGKIIIVGSGYISMEVAAAVAGWGMEVTIVCRGKHVMPRLFDEALAKWMMDIYQARGVKILINNAVKSFLKKGNVVSAVKLVSGRKLQCDAAIVGVGAKPNLDWLGAKYAGMKMEKGAIKVNDQMQTSIKDIYAMGDIICYPSLYGDHRRHAHVDNARKSAIQAARGAVGVDTEPYRYLPYCYSRVFEYTDEPLTYHFYGDKYGRSILVPRGPNSVGAVWEKDKRIVGIMMMGVPGPTAKERESMQRIALEQPAADTSAEKLVRIFDDLSK